jgi:hypothetical protein
VILEVGFGGDTYLAILLSCYLAILLSCYLAILRAEGNATQLAKRDEHLANMLEKGGQAKHKVCVLGIDQRFGLLHRNHRLFEDYLGKHLILEEREQGGSKQETNKEIETFLLSCFEEERGSSGSLLMALCLNHVLEPWASKSGKQLILERGGGGARKEPKKPKETKQNVSLSCSNLIFGPEPREQENQREAQPNPRISACVWQLKQTSYSRLACM